MIILCQLISPYLCNAKLMRTCRATVSGMLAHMLDLLKKQASISVFRDLQTCEFPQEILFKFNTTHHSFVYLHFVML